MSHRVQIKLTRSQAEAAVEALDLLLGNDPSDDEAQAARQKIARALERREVGLAQRGARQEQNR